MAQTKRKRRTKHRGNAAGTVESRGRTSRPPSPDEKKRAAREKAREERLSKRPTWTQSFRRALAAGALVFIFLLITDHPKKGGSSVLPALILAVLMVALYVPAGYYLESFLWRRRMAKRATALRR